MSEPTEAEQPCNEQGTSISYVHTDNLPSFLHEERFSLLVSTYQAGRLLLFTSPEGQRISMLMRKLPHPTGLALHNTRLAVSSRQQIWTFRPARNVRDAEGNLMPHDIVWLPRSSHVTGFIDTHMMVWHKDQLIIANTRYSCLCRLDEDWSFVPTWKPPFISEIAPEDRCHLNGICLNDDGPKYVTALGETNTPEGWRDNKASGGVLIDVPSGEIVTRDLSMPHSPKLYAGHLWLLESGTGFLLAVDESNGKVTKVKQFPGFLRGLAFYKNYAFIGVCKAREKTHFGDLPVEKEFGEFECGVSILDLNTMEQVGFIHFLGGIEELFDIVIMPELTSPSIIGFEDEDLDRIKILPPENLFEC